MEAEGRMVRAETVATEITERLGTEARLRRHLHNLIQQLKGIGDFRIVSDSHGCHASCALLRCSENHLCVCVH